MSGIHRFSEDNHFAEHEHGDSAYTHQSRPHGARPLAIAVSLTLGYAVIELAGGLWSGSVALLFALAANIIARRPASDRHSFGLARLEVIAAFVNALAMLGVVAWIFYEAIDRLKNPVAVKGLGV